MDFIRPVADRFKISHRFGEGFDFSDIFGGVGNYGLDFDTTTHAEVVAVADGYVLGNGYNDEGYGNEVFILHDNELITRYSNLNNYYGVYSGQYIRQYEVIGKTKQDNFHFEILNGNEIEEKTGMSIKDKIHYIYNENNYLKKLNIPSDMARYDPFTGRNSKGEEWSRLEPFKEFPKFKNQINRDNIKTRCYIWRTQGDNKVRSSHAKLEGTPHCVDENIFPGEEDNCRCWPQEIDCESID